MSTIVIILFVLAIVFFIFDFASVTGTKETPPRVRWNSIGLACFAGAFLATHLQ